MKLTEERKRELLSAARGPWQRDIVLDIIRSIETGEAFSSPDSERVLRGRAQNYTLRYAESFRNLRKRLEEHWVTFQYLPGPRGGYWGSSWRAFSLDAERKTDELVKMAAKAAMKLVPQDKYFGPGTVERMLTVAQRAIEPYVTEGSMDRYWAPRVAVRWIVAHHVSEEEFQVIFPTSRDKWNHFRSFPLPTE